jgi:hypothetical protein
MNWDDFYKKCDDFITTWSNKTQDCALKSVYLQASGGDKSFLYPQKDYMPEPFLGNPENCLAVMLNLNPADPMSKFHKYETYAKRIISDGYSKRAKAFSIFEEGDGGSKWWGQRIDWLNRISGNRDENLKPFVVEICPWHSKKWGRLDYNNNELVKTIEENTLNPAFSAVHNAKISNCVIAIGKDYCEVLSELGFKEEVRFMPSSGNLEVFVNGSKNLEKGDYWSACERWPRNKKQELSNRAFTVFSKGENRILCIWSNKGGSNKPPQEGFDTLVKALIEGSY